MRSDSLIVAALLQFSHGQQPTSGPKMRTLEAEFAQGGNFIESLQPIQPASMQHWISISLLFFTFLLPLQADPIYLITDGETTACSGQLFDSGGPNGDYSNNENAAFQICPDQPNECIQFTLDYYNIESNGVDRLAFYDAPGVNPTQLLASIDGGEFADVRAGGGVCFEVAAQSGCLTVAFFSDNTVSMEGFAGRWNCLTENCLTAQPIRLSPGATEDALLAALTDPLTQASITNIECPGGSLATFLSANPNDLGLDQGILLSTGRAINAVGPNLRAEGGTTTDDNGAPGDADLDQISVLNGNAIRSENACIVELDVFATTDELLFEYIFGSEEYPEFVGQEFNDIFAFLISGPGITGEPALNNQLNIATLPNEQQTVVSINTVNPSTNWEYYRANPVARGSVEFDGLTSGFRAERKSLTARAKVTPCETYHLKLAIADRRDADLDSGVFLSDLKAAAPELEVDYVSGVNTLIETCSPNPDQLTIRLPEMPVDLTSYSIEVGGTATPGVDYDFTIPETITFQPGQQEVTFPLRVLGDSEQEGDETIVIRLVRDFGCGPTVIKEETLVLQDQLQVEINEGQESLVVCPGGTVELTATGASTFRWTTESSAVVEEGPSVSLDLEENGFVTVTGNIGNCMATDSIFIDLNGPDITILNPDTILLCRGDTIQLMQTNAINSDIVTWSPTIGIIDLGNPNPRVAPLEDTEYEVAISQPGCIGTDSVFVDVQFLNMPELTNDTTVCQSSPVRLATLLDSDVSETNYQWTPTEGLDDPTNPTPTARPEVTTTYKLVAQTPTGLCIDSAEVTITVTPAELEINEGDTLFVCLGEGPVDLTATTNDGSATVQWSPNIAFDTPPTGLNVTVNPQRTIQYFARTTINGCDLVDSIRVQVDSLPQDLSFMLEPEKDPYCRGEQIIFSSPDYEVADFPDIVHMWTEGPGFQTPDSLYNMVINTVDSANYQRVTMSGACVDTVNQFVPVIEPPQVTVTPQDTTVCAGESFDYLVEIEGGGTVTWEPTDGLSCTDCLDPTATPPSTTNYMIMANTDVGDCDIPIEAIARIRTVPELRFNTNPIICPGESIRLLVGGIQSGSTTYTWTIQGDDSFMSMDPRLEVSPSQTTTYNLLAENECGSTSGAITIIVANPVMFSIAGPDSVCVGDPAMYSIERMAPDGITESFTWVVNGNTVSTESSVTLEFDTDATVVLNYQLADCDVMTQSLNVVVNEAPSLELPSVTTICLGESITLNDAPSAATTYQWSGPSFSTTDAAPIVTPTETTTYSVTATTPSCPALVNSVTINVIDMISLALPDNFTVCEEDSVVVQPAIDPDVPGSFEWAWTNGRSTDRTLRDLPDETTLYTLTYTDEGGCTTVSDSIRVTVQQNNFFTDVEATDVDGTILMDGDTVFVGQPVQLSAIVDPNQGFTFDYSWSGNGLPPTATGNPIEITVPEIIGSAGMLDYTVDIVTNPGGCDLRDDIELIILPSTSEVPNAFTPNGDNTNDVFRVFFSGDIQNFELKVFNRWGQLVFESSDPNEAWDGTSGGEPQPADVYIYRATFTQNAVPVEKNGEVTLVR